jgi:MoxR-like ATPase
MASLVQGVDPQIQQSCDQFRRDYAAVKAEIGKAIVGHDPIVEGVLTCLFVGGHALLEGVPGLGKTALIRALASALDLKFSRIQFTPDLMPADVIGTNVIMENDQGRRAFTFMPGPIFAQIVLADEINRATPKTQSALLEAMQEKQVTAGGQVRKLEEPFFVMATQNPLEQEGTSFPKPSSTAFSTNSSCNTAAAMNSARFWTARPPITWSTSVPSSTPNESSSIKNSSNR